MYDGILKLVTLDLLVNVGSTQLITRNSYTQIMTSRLHQHNGSTDTEREKNKESQSIITCIATIKKRLNNKKVQNIQCKI